MRAPSLPVKCRRHVTSHKFQMKSVPDSWFYSENICAQLIKMNMHYAESQPLSPLLNVKYCLMRGLKTLRLQLFRAHTFGVSQKIYSKIWYKFFRNFIQSHVETHFVNFPFLQLKRKIKRKYDYYCLLPRFLTARKCLPAVSNRTESLF